MPEQVAEEIANNAIDHVASLTMSLLTFDAQPHAVDDPRCTSIYSEVRKFTYYATRGVLFEGDSVHEYMISLIPLYQSVCGGDAAVDGISEDADPETPLGLVICAGLARDRIARGEAVSAVELAVLSDLSDRQVRQLIRDGEIAARGGKISAKTAHRFLMTRKVPGF